MVIASKIILRWQLILVNCSCCCVALCLRHAIVNIVIVVDVIAVVLIKRQCRWGWQRRRDDGIELHLVAPHTCEGGCLPPLMEIPLKGVRTMRDSNSSSAFSWGASSGYLCVARSHKLASLRAPYTCWLSYFGWVVSSWFCNLVMMLQWGRPATAHTHLIPISILLWYRLEKVHRKVPPKHEFSIGLLLRALHGGQLYNKERLINNESRMTYLRLNIFWQSLIPYLFKANAELRVNQALIFRCLSGSSRCERRPATPISATTSTLIHSSRFCELINWDIFTGDCGCSIGENLSHRIVLRRHIAAVKFLLVFSQKLWGIAKANLSRGNRHLGKLWLRWHQCISLSARPQSMIESIVERLVQVSCRDRPIECIILKSTTKAAIIALVYHACWVGI